MIICFYKKTFLNDLARIPLHYRKRIEKLVFEEVPNLDNILNTLDIKKMRGYRDYYRIRIGNYRVGCKMGADKRIIFYRVKKRGEIYKVFP
jgi:mRNA interferase RelE/StbE